MNILRKLRWRLTLSYTVVTVSAFLVVTLILGGIILPRLFIPINILTPEILITAFEQDSLPLLGHLLSQSPVDTELMRLILKGGNSTITNYKFLRIGSLEFSVNTIAMLRVLIIGPDGALLGKSEMGFSEKLMVGSSFDPTQFKGLEAPYKAAQAEKQIRRNYIQF